MAHTSMAALHHGILPGAFGARAGEFGDSPTGLRSLDQAQIDRLQTVLCVSWNKWGDKAGLRKSRAAARVLAQQFSLTTVRQLQRALESIVLTETAGLDAKATATITQIHTMVARFQGPHHLEAAHRLAAEAEALLEEASHIIHPTVLAEITIAEITIRRCLLDLVTRIAEDSLSAAKTLAHAPTSLADAGRQLQELASCCARSEEGELS